ncbi:MAG: hypothetical protein ACR2RL_23105 [Gammaproteobacteria bacterium]
MAQRPATKLNRQALENWPADSTVSRPLYVREALRSRSARNDPSGALEIEGIFGNHAASAPFTRKNRSTLDSLYAGGVRAALADVTGSASM